MYSNAHRYFVLHKPAGILSQFISDSPKSKLLGSLGYPFPEGTHAVGRLDKDTEGLLLLTTDKRVTALLFDAPQKHLRTYLAMVKGEVKEETLQLLKTGVQIKLKQGEYYTAVATDVQIIDNPLSYYTNANESCEEAYTWLLISLTEGKNRQVRKMTSAAQHHCLRLIRLSIENMTLKGIKYGEVKEFPEREFYELLCLTGE
jgi:23S rRNA pseudouridine2457 synthase